MPNNESFEASEGYPPLLSLKFSVNWLYLEVLFVGHLPTTVLKHFFSLRTVADQNTQLPATKQQ